jgi:nucleoside-diphosphate-sugar epimerase
LIQGKKILVTGPAGNIAYPLCRELAKDNEVWGIARFGKPGDREKVEALGVTTRAIDIGSGDFAEIPDDFTYLLHLGAYMSPGADFDAALRVNAEGTMLLLAHCRKAKAALVMSTTGVYRPHEDPWHPFLETDPLGDSNLPGMPTYGLTKLSEEAVARACARCFGLPTVIARMNAAYGDTEGTGAPAWHFELIRAGKPVVLRWDPSPYSPIHDDDIFHQLPALLDAASVPATTVNWGGDVAVAAQDWCALFGEILNVRPNIQIAEFPGSQRGVVVDVAKRKSLTGPCRVDWRDGMRALAEAHLRRAPAHVPAMEVP